MDQVTDQLVVIYDKHYTDDEIKGLLQFYGSPLGQKVAAEMPKINRETQAAIRTVSGKAAREAFTEVKMQNPEIGQNARLREWSGSRAGRWQQRRGQQAGQVSNLSRPRNSKTHNNPNVQWKRFLITGSAF